MSIAKYFRPGSSRQESDLEAVSDSVSLSDVDEKTEHGLPETNFQRVVESIDLSRYLDGKVTTNFPFGKLY